MRAGGRARARVRPPQPSLASKVTHSSLCNPVEGVADAANHGRCKLTSWLLQTIAAGGQCSAVQGGRGRDAADAAAGPAARPPVAGRSPRCHGSGEGRPEACEFSLLHGCCSAGLSQGWRWKPPSATGAVNMGRQQVGCCTASVLSQPLPTLRVPPKVRRLPRCLRPSCSGFPRCAAAA